MEQVAVINFARDYVEINREVVQALTKIGYETISYEGENNDAEVELFTNLKEIKLWLDEHWKHANYFVFIASTDAVMRMVAERITDKMKDPTVLVVDGEGRYVIPMLGNHIGNGNLLASKLSKVLEVEEIYTTPEETRKKFSITKFAEDNNMEIGSVLQARMITASVLEGQQIGFYSDYEIQGEVPTGLVVCKDMKEASWHSQQIAIRNQYVIGMGMREGVSYENIEELVFYAMDSWKMDMIQIQGIATIDERQEETALLEFSRKFKVPILGYSKKELLNATNLLPKGDMEEKNPNISECAAILGSELGELLQEKVSGRDATLAIARKRKTVVF